MGKKSSRNGRLLLWAVVIGFILLAIDAPKSVWIVAALSMGIMYYKARPAAAKTPVKQQLKTTSHAFAARKEPSAVPKAFSSNTDEPISVVQTNGTLSSTFRVPPAPTGFGAAQWVEPGAETIIGGVIIPGGMVYVGTELLTPTGNNDPCLIDPSKSIANRGDYTERQFGYWPSYSEISASARRAYLEWLAGGRQDPSADIGFVFLFFYGLERRVIIDGSSNGITQDECTAVTQELRRLLAIYGDKSRSFHRYASELLNWATLVTYDRKLYEQLVPDFSKTYELPVYLKLALGQAAIDAAPVPVDIALAWARLDPKIVLRTPATRCAEQFEKLFRHKYTELFGGGLILPKNKTKLKFFYQAASSGFQGYRQPTLNFGETPDVSVLTGPVKKIQSLVDSVTKELETFSRFLGRNPDDKASLEGLLLLPATLWPAERQRAVAQLEVRIAGDVLTMSLGELQSLLGAQSTLTRDKVLGLARALESINIGMEPDVLNGAKVPKPEETVVLFSIPPGEPVSRRTAAYHAAALTLELASAVATADGEFSSTEEIHLREQVQSWTHLTPNHLSRLIAYLRLLTVAPASLTRLKKKLEPLDNVAKETLAAFMAAVAQSDGTVAPNEVKMLEKVYNALGIDSTKVFSHLHQVATDTPVLATSSNGRAAEFKLDHSRVAALQQDTEKVTALLSSIFTEELASEASEPPVEAEPAAVSTTPLGLDEQHGSLTRLLLSRPQWTRTELLDAAEDLDLLLDGALEHINEAAFDQFDMPLTEGTDPIEVNTELLEKIEA
ncbi:TerB N-terminal domain-containing protein [Alcaligenes aquatilis]|uniref:Tellurite resistance protein TerB n=1 Tax=Alcaligenes aquatilis TaxID=323284 RepID=A0A3G2HPS9_9BURK|nr:TerB N-terminal domain-containing protein [Alcaligenes aquatilis]AYN19054.1 hypothetical protein D3M96_00025 [Alcaligenes aquatilis]